MSEKKNSAGPTSRVPSISPALGGADNSSGRSGREAAGTSDSDTDAAGREKIPPASIEEGVLRSNHLLPETMTGGPISRRRAREILQSGKRAEKAELLSLLLTYAEWDEIWSLVDEASVRELFPHLDLPAKLHRAWARFLGLPTG